MLSPYPPYPLRSGGALRIYHVARGLAEHHEVTLLSFAPHAAAVAALAPLRAWCHVVTVPSPAGRSVARRALTTLTSSQPDMALRAQSHAYSEALSRLVASTPFALVLAASIEMAGYLLPLRGLGPRLVLDQFNAEYLLQRRAALSDLALALRLRPRALVGGLYSLLQWRKLARYERMLLAQLDTITVVSEQDRNALARLHPAAAQRLVVVPNGVDTSLVRPGAVRGDLGGATMVFTGTLDYRPNIDALRWFTAEVLPLIRARAPTARLLIVGRAAGAAIHALASEAVEVIGEVAAVAPYIDGAAVYVVPMRIGGGSRLKLLEALAMEAPIVTTPMGAEGIVGLRDGTHLLMAERPKDFANAVLRLIADPTLGQRLGSAGRAHVVANYDWRIITGTSGAELGHRLLKAQ
ncbi:glycosyltransferase [Candidatus Viridilinea mediisalina]|nr:glycosyltransferase [Candidatus Viridilinea mediisalina]